MLLATSRVANITNPMAIELRKAREDTSEAVKTALLIIRPAQGQAETAQYPDTFKKALQILRNYQVPKSSLPFRASPSKGVAFIQQG